LAILRKIAGQRAKGYCEKSRLYGVLSLMEKRPSIPMRTSVMQKVLAHVRIGGAHLGLSARGC
jgi:hypothetical protein